MNKKYFAYCVYFIVVLIFYTVYELRASSCEVYSGSCFFSVSWAVFPYIVACVLACLNKRNGTSVGIILNALVLFVGMGLMYHFLHLSKPDAQGALALLLIPFPQFLIISIYAAFFHRE